LDLLPVELRPTPRPRYGLAAALADFWARIAPSMPPFWRTRFIDHLSVYFDSYREETANRYAATPPDLPTYIDLRRRSGATTTCFDLIEVTGGFTLSDAIFHSEPFQSLYTAAIDIIGWGNDVMSVDKELARGDVHNLLIVLHHAEDSSWADAAQRAADMINQRWQEFFAAEHELSFLPAAIASTERDWASIQRYVSGIKSWMAGIHHWHLKTSRYHQIEYTSTGQAPGYLDKLILAPPRRG
jgi:avermitilol synthase